MYLLQQIMYKYACCEQMQNTFMLYFKNNFNIHKKKTLTDPGMSLGWWQSSLYDSAMQNTQTDYISRELIVRCGFMTNCQFVRDYEVPLFPL